MDRPLTIDELSHILNLPKSWIYSKTRSNEIPHFKVGKYLRFSEAEISRWFQDEFKVSND